MSESVQRPVPERQAFLLALSDAIRPLRDPQAVKAAASRVLCEQLGSNRAFYAEIDGDDWVVEGGFAQGVAALPPGRYAAGEFGHRIMDTYRAGQRVVFGDARTDAEFSSSERAAHITVDIIGAVGVPLVKDGRLIAILAVHSASPREWTHDEVLLVQETAERTWAAVEQARAEASLRESEARFRTLTESLPQLVWTCSADGSCDYLSRQWVIYTGVPEAEQLGMNWLDRVIHPDDRERTREHWLGAVAGLHSYDIEYRIRTADGAYRWFQARGVPFRNSAGVVEKWFGTCTDIEGQKRAAAELQRQWHTFDTALSHTPDFTYIFDRNGRFTYINRALLSLWQLPLEAAVGKNFFELNYPEDLAARLQAQIQQVIETKGVVRDNTPYTGPTGETRYYEYIFVPVFASDGFVEAVTGSTRDVTDRVHIEQALAASELKLQQVFAQAPVAIVAFRGENFVVEMANPLYHSVLPGRELVGRPFAEVVPDLGQEVWDVLRGVMTTGVPFVANEWLVPFDQNGDGVPEDHWFNVVYHPLREVNGDVTGLIAVLTDVTGHVLTRMDLERANRDLAEFAYVASHDLQEPLRMVNMYTQMLVRRFGQGDDQVAQYAGIVQEGVTRMGALLRDLLAYSRSTHANDTAVGTADLGAALVEATAMVAGRIQETGAVILADPLPMVKGDTGQLALVLQNVIGNALKYRSQETPQVRITASRNEDIWTISVRDNGIGFDQEYAERIFGLFKRLHSANDYPGTGLGLAICQRIVERFGGRMWATSSVGQGATFSFALHVPQEQ